MTSPSEKRRILLAGVETSANLQEMSIALAEDLSNSISLARFGSHPFYSLEIDEFNLVGVERVKVFEAPDSSPKFVFARELGTFLRRQKGLFFVFSVLFKYDVVIFNWTRSFMALNLDYLLLRLAGRKVIVRHCGSDVRYYPLQHSVHRAFGVNQWQHGKDNVFSLWSKFFAQIWAERTATVLSTRDHATFQTRELVKRPYVQAPIQKTAGFRRTVPLIVHAPSNPEIKGTQAVKRAINLLEQEGFVIEFRMLHGVSHEQVIGALSEAMIVIDQPGAVPARLAVEAMTAGCAVVGGNVPEINMMADLPIIRFEDNGDRLADVIRTLLLDRQSCEDLGNRARAYALDHYSRAAFRAYFDKVLNGQAETFGPLSGRIFLMERGAHKFSEKIALGLLRVILQIERRAPL